MINTTNNQSNTLHDPIKESMMSAEIYKKDGRVKKPGRWTKNKVGLRFIDCIDFKDMSKEDIEERLSESWNPKKGYEFVITKTYIKRKSMMSGIEYYERYDTPNFCSPSSEAYWSM